MKHFLYISISTHPEEARAFTIGITKDMKRRAYEKHMQIIFHKSFPTKRAAKEVEDRLLLWAKDNYPLAYVRFGAWEMQEYTTNGRGWEWFYNAKTGAPLDELKELL